MPTDFRVVAILAAYNEADIIAQVVADLIDQGVRVYLIDDGSTDGTVTAVEPFVGRGLLAIESSARRDAGASADPFNWTRILQRKSAIAREVDADWCIHHDADEFRESPWRGITVRDAVQPVEPGGFNAIDFASLDFWPVHDRFQPGDDVRQAFTHYAERAPYDRVQVRAWKNTVVDVDLASTGGHDAQFPGRRVFPLRFIARHYPIRSQAHGARKVFQERVGRFRADERARGWHVQYDEMAEGAPFIRDRSTLIEYDPDAVRLALTLRHRGVEALETALDEARCVADVQRRQRDELQAAYRAQERDLDAHRAELDRHHREIEKSQREVEVRGDALEAAARELENRTRDVESHRRELERHCHEIEKYQREVAARGEALARTTQEIGAMRAELERCAAYVASVEAEADRRGRYGSALEAELTRAARVIAERETALADRTNSLDVTSARLTAAEAENAARTREIAAARDFIARQGSTIDSLERAVADAGRRVDAVRRSLSWRLTAPARALLRAIRGR